MGVDTVLVAIVPYKWTDREITKAAYLMGEAFGPQNFWINNPKKEKHYGENKRHCLEQIDFDEEFGYYGLVPSNIPDGSTGLVVREMWRYYGPGYERGPFPTIYMVALYLEKKYDATVYYGGDSYDSLQVFDTARREEYLQHFVKYGHQPYAGNRIEGPLSDRPFEYGKRVCYLCEEPLTRYGWGGGYAAMTCRGCGFVESTRDGGLTWVTKDES